VRNDGEFCAARSKVEDCFSRISLRKEGLIGLQVDKSPACSDFFQKGSEIEGHTFHLIATEWHLPDAVFTEAVRRERARFRLGSAVVLI
jgi:hypothetical protein